MNYIKIDTCNLNNGEGARVILWVAGCDFHCKSCHNKESWNFNIGEEFNEDTMKYLLKCLDSKYIKGLSILGGEPLHKKNIEKIMEICNSVKNSLPSKDIWIWTGFKIEELENIPNCDYIIDGLYCESLPTKKNWRGSDNQRMFQVKNGKYILID